MLKTPEGAFRYSVEVRFRDLDALGHVNNAVYLTYLESARIAYWMTITGDKDLKGLAMILARMEVDYRSPAHYGETLNIDVWCPSIGKKSFDLLFRATERKEERLVVEARAVLVCYDYALQKTTPVSETLRAQLGSA